MGDARSHIAGLFAVFSGTPCAGGMDSSAPSVNEVCRRRSPA